MAYSDAPWVAVPQNVTSLLDHNRMRLDTQIICSLVRRVMGKRCFPVEEKGSVLWLCQPVGFQVNVKGMTGNGNIDVFRTNGSGSLAMVSKLDTTVSFHNLLDVGN